MRVRRPDQGRNAGDSPRTESTTYLRAVVIPAETGGTIVGYGADQEELPSGVVRWYLRS